MSQAIVSPDATVGPEASIGPFAVVGMDGPADETTVLGRDANIRSHAVIYRAVRAGDRFTTGHGALVREHTTLGDDCSVGSYACLESHITAHDRVRFHSQCIIGEYTLVEEGAWIGPAVILVNSRYPARPGSRDRFEPVTVRREAVIGTSAVVLAGVTIGEGALVGAGSIVTADVPPGAVVAGNPARQVRSGT